MRMAQTVNKVDSYIFQDFAKFDSSRSEVQDIDELNHFDLYLVHWKSLMGFLQNPHLLAFAYIKLVLPLL
ncbi:hypothetical protein J2W98_002447 [Paenibacillus peoriae]|jgi:hypothetical protein|uniref:Uncharacterized protein n=1 Tax=Paenibacillus peoriae TaxID=59893 RepID=A0ABU1QG24_9BACL|nr:hypothetical protein [Paenibacillus peoriae]